MAADYINPVPAEFQIIRIDQPGPCEANAFHIHRQFEVCYELEGGCRYFIEDAVYTVSAGSVVLVGKGQMHKAHATGSGPSSRIVVNFTPEYLAGLQQCFPGIDFTGFFCQQENRLLSRTSVREQNRIQTLLLQLLELRDEPGSEADAARKMLLATLLLRLKESCHAQQRKGGGIGCSSNRTVDQVQRFIAAHYAEKLSLSSIAERFHVSPCYLSRLFKQAAHVNLVEYINGVRVKAAQSLLENTENSVAEIAAAAGFTTAAHFRRVFRESSGDTPQHYRQRFHRMHPPEIR